MAAGRNTAGAAAVAQAPEKITIRFTWKLKGEYAPLFVALDKGYYRAEGLDVELAEGSGAQTVLKLLASGNEKFGYGPAVSAAQAVSQGLPVKVVALYQTKAPMGVISFPDVPLKSPKDLEGKRLAISVGETFGDMLGPFTRINHVDIDKIQQIQMDASARSTPVPHPQDRRHVGLSQQRTAADRKARRHQVQRAASVRVRPQCSGRLHDRQQCLCRAEPRDGQEGSPRDQQGISRRHGESERGGDAHGQIHEGSRRPRCPRQQVEATVVSTNAPQGKPLGWQEAADWEANLSLLKETGGIAELKPLNAYYTNEYLQ